MNIWENAVITDKGIALQSKLIKGTSLKITRMVTGSGTVPTSMLARQTSVNTIKQNLEYKILTYPESGKCEIKTLITNDDLTEGYDCTQIGFYAEDPDEGEILYLIAQASDSKGVTVPSKTEMPGFSSEWDFYFQYGQADNVQISVDPTAYLTAEQLNNAISSHDTSETAHSNLIARITPEGIGAAAASHTHAQNEITGLSDALSGKADTSHTHTKDEVGLWNVDNTSDAEKSVSFATTSGSANKTKNAMTVRLNGGDTEGSNKFTFDGSVAKSVNITPAKIGAAPITDDGSVVSNGADYAICFSWSDGNPSKENRLNRFVCLSDGGSKISIANANSDICGVTTDSAGFIENYSINSEYTSFVGVLGVVTVIDNGSCTVGNTCMSDDNGYAIPSTNNMGYRVMERVSASKINIAVKPNDDMIQRIKTDVTKLQTDLSSHTHTTLQITDFPSALKNPKALHLISDYSGVGLEYDGSKEEFWRLNASWFGGAAIDHTHTFSTGMTFTEVWRNTFEYTWTDYDFEAQTIEVDLNEYDGVAILADSMGSGAYDLVGPIPFFGSGSYESATGRFLSIGAYTPNSSTFKTDIRLRNFWAYRDRVEFGGCGYYGTYQGEGGDDPNVSCRPWIIYGVKMSSSANTDANGTTKTSVLAENNTLVITITSTETELDTGDDSTVPTYASVSAEETDSSISLSEDVSALDLGNTISLLNN